MSDFGDDERTHMVSGKSLMGSRGCFTWDEGSRQCFVLTDPIVQVLPVVDFDVVECDRYTPHPHHWVPIKIDAVEYFSTGSPLSYINVDKCFITLRDSITSADVILGGPSCAARCSFCESHPYARIHRLRNAKWPGKPKEHNQCSRTNGHVQPSMGLCL